MPLSSIHHPFADHEAAIDVLRDIATHIQIESMFQMRHSHYQPLDLPPPVVTSYDQFPQAQQRRFQAQKLRDYLHDIYFSHEQLPLTTAQNQTGNEPMVNTLQRGLDRHFYQQLHNANQGRGYWDHGWQMIRHERNDILAVKDNLTIKLKPHQYRWVESSEQGADIAVRLPKNQLENGFYVAIGEAGPVLEAGLELYFNVRAEGASSLMSAMTQALNILQLPFMFKMLYEPQEYRRYDAGILSIRCADYSLVRTALQPIYDQLCSDFDAQIPLLTLPLAPGIGLAEEPNNEPHNFGLHRCQLIAHGLLAAWENQEDPEQRLRLIQQQFEQQHIDLQAPHLNTRSANLYLPLV